MAIEIPRQRVQVNLPAPVLRAPQNKVGAAIAQFGAVGARLADQHAELMARQRAAADEQSARLSLARYKSEFQTRYQQRVTQGHEGLSDDAGAMAEELRAATLENAPESVRARLDEEIQIWNLGRQPGIAHDERAGFVNQARGDLEKTVTLSGDQYLGAQTPEDRQDAEQAIRDSIMGAVATGIMTDEQGLDAIEGKLAELSEVRARRLLTDDPHALVAAIDGEEFANLDDKRREMLRDSAIGRARSIDENAERERERAVRMAQAQRDAAEAEQRANFMADVSVAVSRGEVTQAQLDIWRDEGRVSPAQWAKFTKARDDQLAEAEGVAIQTARVAAALDGGGRLDPQNKADRETAEAHFIRMVQQSEGMDPDERNTRVAEFVDGVGIVPKALQSQMRLFAASGDPAQVVQSADLFDRVRAKSPEMLSQLDERTQSMLVGVLDMTRAGVPAAEAVEMTRKRIYETSETERKARALAVSKAAETNDEELNDFIDEKWGRLVDILPGVSGASDADVPAHLQVEFAEAKRAFMEADPTDPERAAKLAFDRVGRVWGLTRVNGKPQLVRNPIERVHGRGTDGEWIRDQIESDLEPMLKGAEYQLTPAPGFDRDPRKPYAVMVRDGDGRWGPLRDEAGRPAMFVPDFDRHQDEVKAEQIAFAERQRKNIDTNAALGRRREEFVAAVRGEGEFKGVDRERMAAAEKSRKAELERATAKNVGINADIAARRRAQARRLRGEDDGEKLAGGNVRVR